jgi:hypothetical protein
MAVEQKFLTNERWKDRFKNNFEMINIAIKLAKEHILASEPRTVGMLIEELLQLYPKKQEG